MKKTNYTTLGIFLVLSLFWLKSEAQAFSKLDKVPHDISYYRETRVTPPLVKVLYGRPSKKGKQVFGNLIPYGEVWRTGYNEATEVKFYKDVKFGGETVKAGTYVLITIPGEKEWKVILNSQLDTWGAFQYDPLFNIAEVTVPVNTAESMDIFSIAFKKKQEIIEMTLGWDDTRIKIPLQFKKEIRSLAHRENR